MLKLIFVIIATIMIFAAPSKARANIIDLNGDNTHYELGDDVKILFQDIMYAIRNNSKSLTQAVGDNLAKVVVGLYTIWFLCQIFVVAVKGDGKELLKLVLFKSLLMGVVYYLLKHIDTALNSLILEPFTMLYNFLLFSVSGDNDTSSLLQTLGNSIVATINQVNTFSGNPLMHLGAFIVSIVMFFFLIAVLLMVFIILIKNYMVVSLVFVTSPVLVFFSFFKNLRAMSIKGAHIVLAASFKQLFIFAVIYIVSGVFESIAKGYTGNMTLGALISLIVVVLVYMEFLKVAEALASDLTSTMSYGSGQGSALMGAGVMVGGMLATGGLGLGSSTAKYIGKGMSKGLKTSAKGLTEKVKKLWGTKR